MAWYDEDALKKRKDLYEVLEIDIKNCAREEYAKEEIEKQYQKLKVKHKQDSDDLKELEGAYKILSDDVKRSVYNQMHNIKFGLDAVNQELKNDINDFLGKPVYDTGTQKKQTTDSNSAENTPPKTSQQDEQGANKQQKTQRENTSPNIEEFTQSFDGESKAYKDIELDIYGNVKEKKKKSQSAGGKIKAPERKPSKGGGGGGKTIMEVFWNEIIVAAYEKSLDLAVDFTLDFADWVLFNAYDPQTVQKEEAQKEKKSIWDYARDVYKKYSKDADGSMEIFQKAHTELMKNIELAKNGIAPKWKVWPNEKEPSFFKQVVEIAKKAEEDPHSPEAKKWERFCSMPEIMENLYEKELQLRKMSIFLATEETQLKIAAYKHPSEITYRLKEMKELKLGPEKNYELYQKNMQRLITELRDKIKEDTSVNRQIGAQLDEMEKLVNNKDIKKEFNNITSGLSAHIKAIGNITPEFTLSPSILKNLKEIDKIGGSTSNIDKYKKAVSAKVIEIQSLAKGNQPIDKEINKQLAEIEKALKNPKATVEDLVKIVGKTTASMREITPLRQEIDESSQAYYDRMRKNIDKIKVIYGRDPEQCRENIKQYLKNITENIKQAQPEIDNFAHASHLKRALINTGHAAYNSVKGLMGKKDPIAADAIMDRMEQKASDGFKKANSIIDDFEINGRRLRDYAVATETPNPFKNKQSVFNAYKDYSGGR
ncbi:MAG: hypothetical protein IJ864_03120 [Alphaproteobacteria bacterium]|nr:hypothetical protein [Alphaproteobacteria bacterium]